MPMGNFPESLSQAILAGIMLVGRLGVLAVDVLRGLHISIITIIVIIVIIVTHTVLLLLLLLILSLS